MRYWIAVLLVVTLPPAYLFWFVVHPWPDFWRRLGKWPSMIILYAGMIGVIVALVPLREWLIGRDLGPNTWLFGLGLLLYVPAVGVALARRRHLKFAILTGLPEIAPEEYTPKLLDQGIYARVRHPRYLEVMLGVTAWAFVANYSGVYVTVVIAIVALLVLIPLEERELVERLGPEYEEYRQRVPMLIPRWRG